MQARSRSDSTAIKTRLLESTDLSIGEIEAIWREWKASNVSNELTDPDDIIRMATKLGILRHLLPMIQMSVNADDIGSSIGEESHLWNVVLIDPKVRKSVVDCILRFFDSNKDGHIDFQELIVGVSILSKGGRRERHKFQFNAVDTDGNGTLSRDEVMEMIRCSMTGVRMGLILGLQEVIAEAEIEEGMDCLLNSLDKELVVLEDPALLGKLADVLFTAVDTNNDKVISLDEYLSWVNDEIEALRFSRVVENVLSPILSRMNQRLEEDITKLIQDIMIGF